jgi:hypothetical protein
VFWSVAHIVVCVLCMQLDVMCLLLMLAQLRRPVCSLTMRSVVLVICALIARNRG